MLIYLRWIWCGKFMVWFLYKKFNQTVFFFKAPGCSTCYKQHKRNLSKLTICKRKRDTFLTPSIFYHIYHQKKLRKMKNSHSNVFFFNVLFLSLFFLLFFNRIKMYKFSTTTSKWFLNSIFVHIIFPDHYHHHPLMLPFSTITCIVVWYGKWTKNKMKKKPNHRTIRWKKLLNFLFHPKTFLLCVWLNTSWYFPMVFFLFFGITKNMDGGTFYFLIQVVMLLNLA